LEREKKKIIADFDNKNPKLFKIMRIIIKRYHETLTSKVFGKPPRVKIIVSKTGPGFRPKGPNAGPKR
jgi:hypothetical protein